MLMSARPKEQAANPVPEVTCGEGFRLRPEQPEALIGTCPRCRVLLSFEIGLAPDPAAVGLDNPEELARLFHSRRGRPRKQATQAAAQAAQPTSSTVPDPAALAQRLVVYDRKVLAQADGGKLRLIHASCGTPLTLFR